MRDYNTADIKYVLLAGKKDVLVNRIATKKAKSTDIEQGKKEI